MIEKPKFWSWATLTLKRDDYKDALQSSRVNIVQEIIILADICEDNIYINILENILTVVRDGGSHLKKLCVTCLHLDVDLSSLDPALLSQGLVRLEECWLNNFGLSREQLVAVCTAIEQTNNLKLRTLILSNLDRHNPKVPTEILAAAVLKLVETNILEIYLNRNISTDLTHSLITRIVC